MLNLGLDLGELNFWYRFLGFDQIGLRVRKIIECVLKSIYMTNILFCHKKIILFRKDFFAVRKIHAKLNTRYKA